MIFSPSVHIDQEQTIHFVSGQHANKVIFLNLIIFMEQKEILHIFLKEILHTLHE
jgi:hypothetical protein